MINEAYLKEDPKKNLVLRIVLPFPCNFVHNHSESLSVSIFDKKMKFIFKSSRAK